MNSIVEQRGQRIVDAGVELIDIRIRDLMVMGGPGDRVRSDLLARHIAALIDGVALWDIPALDRGGCDGCPAADVELIGAGGAGEVMLCRVCIKAALAEGREA